MVCLTLWKFPFIRLVFGFLFLISCGVIWLLCLASSILNTVGEAINNGSWQFYVISAIFFNVIGMTVVLLASIMNVVCMIYERKGL